MSKKLIALIILITFVFVVAVDLVIGNYISARLSTTSWAREWGLFNPQAPIVVTNRETVRVNSNNDVVDTAENAKSKTATLVYIDGAEMVTTGSAVNWTSDGYFVTSDSALSVGGKVYAVITSSGDLFPVEAAYPDPASNIVVLQTAARGLTVFSPAEESDLRVGNQVVMVQNSVGNNQTRFYTGFVKRLSSDISGLSFESDFISRSMELALLEPVPSGSAVLNLSGRMIGIWDGEAVVPAESVRELVNNLLANEREYARPAFGFSYQMLNEVESKAVQTERGARVLTVVANDAAARGGLRAGDVITEVDGQRIDDNFNLDNWLRQVKPGQSVNFSVFRAGSTVSLIIAAEEL
ncbi:MAG TPA: S1C family serine protease [Candidatus Doudnabacteria bacterium]|nr:S1C family serine protease [Candidatus Doudnabacteria bacterium]